MELTTATVGTLTRYLKGRKYKRFQTPFSSRRKLPVATLGGGGRRRSWKVRIMPKRRLRWSKIVVAYSPMKLLSKVKNTYVNMMLNLSGNVGSLNNGSAFGSNQRVAKVPTVYSSKKVEQRLVYEIYLAFKGSRDFVSIVQA